MKANGVPIFRAISKLHSRPQFSLSSEKWPAEKHPSEKHSNVTSVNPLDVCQYRDCTQLCLIFRLACRHKIAFVPRPMSLLPTADLLALDISGLKRRLSMLRRYL